MFGAGDGVTFGRMESLRTDLLAFLDSVGITPTEAMSDFVLQARPVNTRVATRRTETTTTNRCAASSLTAIAT